MRAPALLRTGRPVRIPHSVLQETRLRHDLATLVVADFGGRHGARRSGFETEADCALEDHFRSRQLAALSWPSAQQLSLLLGDSGDDYAPDTLASRRYQREFRRVQGDTLITQMEGNADEELCTFTIVQPDWRLQASDLAKFDSRELLTKVRRGLPQRESMPGNSWLFGQVHGEFDIRTESFQPHVHGVCTVDYVADLRKMVRRCDRRLIPQPMRVEKIDPPNRARQVSYVLQSYWPHRPTFICNGVVLRTRRKGRIPEPWSSMVLLWLHRQTLGSIQLRVGLGSCSLGSCTRMSSESPS